MIEDNRAYHAYLLRLWRVNAGESQIWRASLEDPYTGERLGFADLPELFAFLAEQIDFPGRLDRARVGYGPRENDHRDHGAR